MTSGALSFPDLACGAPHGCAGTRPPSEGKIGTWFASRLHDAAHFAGSHRVRPCLAHVDAGLALSMGRPGHGCCDLAGVALCAAAGRPPRGGLACASSPAGAARASLLRAGGFAGRQPIVHALKLAVARTRPGLFEPLVTMPIDPSFPSAHTMQACAFAVACLLQCRHPARLTGWLLAAAFVTLVGASRVYLQVHYPSDVLAGAAVALAWVGALWRAWPGPSAAE